MLSMILSGRGIKAVFKFIVAGCILAMYVAILFLAPATAPAPTTRDPVRNTQSTEKGYEMARRAGMRYDEYSRLRDQFNNRGISTEVFNDGLLHFDAVMKGCRLPVGHPRRPDGDTCVFFETGKLTR
jgi:hypothetical protein